MHNLVNRAPYSYHGECSKNGSDAMCAYTSNPVPQRMLEHDGSTLSHDGSAELLHKGQRGYMDTSQWPDNPSPW